MSDTQWVGKPIQRADALSKVTGRAKYTGDLALPAMAHAALVRSTVGHGKIRRIDTSTAAAAEEVIAVVTGRDLAALGVIDPNFGLTVRDQPMLTDGRVRYSGEAVAAVVAESATAAPNAAGLVDVDIEPIDAVYTVEDALESESRVHPDRDSAGPEGNNIAARTEFSAGDVDGALADAHFVHDAVYRFPMVAHYPMEPHCCIASWSDGHEQLEVTSSTQQPFKVRADLARMFGLSHNRVRVRVPYVGGGFGGKLLSKYGPLTAALSLSAGRPVRLSLRADESFRTISRHGAVVHMRTGIDKTGAIVARDAQVILDTGAYSDKGPGVAKKAAYRAKGPYDIPNFRSVALAVYTNKVPAGAFRGYSTPQIAWAGESAINEIANHLGVDPLQYRLDHLLPRGGPFMPGDTPLDADLANGLKTAADSLGWSAPLLPGRGRGIASGVKDGGGGPSRAEAEVRLLGDGSAEVLTGTCEIGQGAHTVFAQMAAEELRCDPAAVTVRLPDTVSSPFDHGTEASRSTVLVGNAVRNAAHDVAGQLEAVVTRQLGPGNDYTIEGQNLVFADGREVMLAELLARDRDLPASHEFEIGPIVSLAYHNTLVSSEAPLGTPSTFYEVGHGAVELEVDEDTGRVRLIKYASAADVGRAINPETCAAQDEGAVIMAIGHTLFEHLIFDEGEMINGNLAEYRLPLTSDLPVDGLKVALVENGDGPGPWGAKGAGEAGIISLAPAVAEAVFQVAGVRIRELPLSPSRVWHAVRERNAT